MALINKRKYIKPEMKTTGIGYHISNIKKQYVRFTINLGAFIFFYAKSIFKNILNTVKTFVIFTIIKLNYLFKKLFKLIKVLFIRMLEHPEDTVDNFSGHFNNQREESSLLKALAFAIKNTWSKRKIFSSVFNYVAPVLSIAFLVSLVSFGTKQPYVLSIECNGKLVGYVETEATAQEAEHTLMERINYVEGDKEIKIQPKISVLKASGERQVSNSDQIADSLIKTSDAPFVECYGFYINGEFNGAITDKAQVEQTLNNKLDVYKKRNPDAKINFVDDYEFKKGYYLENGVISADILCNKLKGYKQSEGTYIVKSGDTFISIAKSFGIPVSDLMDMNPDLNENLSIGQKILVNRAKPFVSVEVVKTETSVNVIPFAKKTQDNPDEYKSYSKTIQSGKNGKKQITANVTYVDNEVVKKDIITSQVLSHPVTEIVEVGSKKTEDFLWPAPGNTQISAYYGYTAGYFNYSVFHKGIDIECPTGSKIRAVMSGTVTFASWTNDYGYLVTIDHGNGYVTYYAHNSSLKVKTGQYVDQGELISVSGSTGRSTGPHLHFEVRLNGLTTNPRNYKYVY